MPTYQAPCPDGSDGNCYRTVDVFIPVEDLDDEEVIEYIEDHDPDISSCSACGSDYYRDSEGNIIIDQFYINRAMTLIVALHAFLRTSCLNEMGKSGTSVDFD